MSNLLQIMTLAVALLCFQEIIKNRDFCLSLNDVMTASEIKDMPKAKMKGTEE